jgi:hypothetical protein
MGLDLLIRNGTIVDGYRAERYRRHLVVRAHVVGKAVQEDDRSRLCVKSMSSSLPEQSRQWWPDIPFNLLFEDTRFDKKEESGEDDPGKDTHN